MYGEEIQMELEPLTYENETYVSGFFCGKDASDFNEYVQCDALEDEEARTVVYLTKANDSDEAERHAVAFCSLACGSVIVESKGVGEQNFQHSIPAVFIDKFAVDEKYQHLAYTEGKELTLSQMIMYDIKNYIGNIASNVIGAKYIILYSTEKTHNFYLKCQFYDFESEMTFGNDPRYSDCIPMYSYISRD